MFCAPKAGEEMRDNCGDYAREVRHRGRRIVNRMSDRIPERLKAAAGFGG